MSIIEIDTEHYRLSVVSSLASFLRPLELYIAPMYVPERYGESCRGSSHSETGQWLHLLLWAHMSLAIDLACSCVEHGEQPSCAVAPPRRRRTRGRGRSRMVARTRLHTHREQSGSSPASHHAQRPLDACLLAVPSPCAGVSLVSPSIRIT